jgi:hypothetical protein
MRADCIGRYEASRANNRLVTFGPALVRLEAG